MTNLAWFVVGWFVLNAVSYGYEIERERKVLTPGVGVVCILLNLVVVIAVLSGWLR